MGFWFLPFESAMMLAWGLAAAVPIALHLWNRRRRQVVDWAATRFLIAGLKRHARRMRIEQLSLLALRILILLLFAALVADPFLPRGGAWADLASGDRTHWILVLDASFSMQRRADDGTAFERARRRAEEIVAAGEQGDGYSIVRMGDAASAIVGEPSFDAAAVRDELQSLEPLDGGADLNAALAEVERLTSLAARENPRLRDRAVVFLTDSQKRTWDAAADPATAARLATLAEGARLSIVDVGSDETANLAVTRLAPRDPIVLAGAPTIWEAEIRNFGDERRSTAVALAVDGAVVETKRIDVEPGEQASVTLGHRFEAPGAFAVEARLSGDPLPPDDVRRFSVVAREALRILLVGEDPRSRFFLARALDPLGEGSLGAGPPGEGRGIAIDAVGPAGLADADLSKYDAIVISDVARIAESEGASLRRFVGQGGGLALFPGPSVSIESWNQALGGDDATPGLLPAPLDELRERELRLSATDLSHPLVAAFRGNAQSGLFRVPTWIHYALDPDVAQGARTIVTFENGDPAAVEKTYRAGRVVLFATAGFAPTRGSGGDDAEAWTALPAAGDFVSLMQETTRFLVLGSAGSRNVRVGEALVASRGAVSSGLDVAIVRPGGARIRLEGAVRPDGETTWTFDDTNRAGFYDLTAGDGDLLKRFAVDVEVRESDPARIDPSSLPPVFDRTTTTAEAADVASLDDRPIPLFPLLIAALLLLVGVEAIVAWRFGAQRATRGVMRA